MLGRETLLDARAERFSGRSRPLNCARSRSGYLPTRPEIPEQQTRGRGAVRTRERGNANHHERITNSRLRGTPTHLVSQKVDDHLLPQAERKVARFLGLADPFRLIALRGSLTGVSRRRFSRRGLFPRLGCRLFLLLYLIISRASRISQNLLVLGKVCPELLQDVLDSFRRSHACTGLIFRGAKWFSGS